MKYLVIKQIENEIKLKENLIINILDLHRISLLKREVYDLKRILKGLK